MSVPSAQVVSKFPTPSECLSLASLETRSIHDTLHVTGINMNLQPGTFLQPNGQHPRHQYQSVLTTSGGMQVQTRQPRPIVKTYVSEEQERMLQAFGDDGEDPNFGALIKTILEIEKDKAPKPDISRLLGLEYAPNVMTGLLWQRSPKEIRCILRNELPQEMRGSLLGEMRRPAVVDSGNGYDPVIYDNFIVDKNFLGVPIAEYDKFLTAVEMAAGLDVPHQRNQGLDAATVVSGVRTIYRTIRGLSRDADFFKEFSNEELRDNARSWVAHHRGTVLPRAEQQQVSHITTPAEVGLSSKGYKRCGVHRNLEPGSPHLFRLVQLVLRGLFPSHGFHLEQVYLFELIQEGQGEIGESMGTILSAGYGSMGGLNFEQAGISQTGLTTMNLDHWKAVAAAAKPNEASGRLRHIRGNILAEETMLKAAITEQEEKRKDIEVRALNRRAYQTFSQYGERLDVEMQDIEQLKDESFDLIEGLRNDRENAQEASKVVQEASSAMSRLLGKLSSLPRRSSSGE